MTVKKLSLPYIAIYVYILALEAAIRTNRQTFKIHENAICHALLVFVMFHLNIWQGPGFRSNHTNWPLGTRKRWERGGGGGSGDRGSWPR